jgi:hypothetical protein
MNFVSRSETPTKIYNAPGSPLLRVDSIGSKIWAAIYPPFFPPLFRQPASRGAASAFAVVNRSSKKDRQVRRCGEPRARGGPRMISGLRPWYAPASHHEPSNALIRHELLEPGGIVGRKLAV